MAHRRVVEAHRASAAAFFAAAQAFTHRLDHLLASLVAGLAADADAVGGHLARAVAASEVALANADAIPTTADRAEAAG